MKKKIGILAAVLAAVLAVGGGSVWFFKVRPATGNSGSENAVFVNSVADITGLGLSGVNSRFSGVVEPQRTVNVEVASGMKVKDTFVTVGQEVSEGTRLFSYDTEEAQDSVAQLEIDIENYDITIESTQNQIKQLEKERDKVSQDEKLAYTTQIMTAENSIKRSEYEKKSKQAEMESLKRQIANAVVTSELKGVVKTINKNNSGSSDMGESYSFDESSNSNAYMTIMATGDYRIKGSINEQNIQELMEGTNVIVHSRVDENKTWKGTIATIDRENATSNQNNSMMYMGGDSSLTTSNSYPFYVDMEDSTGLMLGQHVYIEADYGQGEEREGIWLDDYYLILDEDGQFSNYVWAATADDRLEKRELKLGEYDAEAMQYQILEGLTVDDYIAFPADELAEGQKITRNIEQAGGMMSDDMMSDDMMSDDMMSDDMMSDDMMSDDMMSDDMMGDDMMSDDMMSDDMMGDEEIYEEEPEAGFDEELQVFEGE